MGGRFAKRHVGCHILRFCIVGCHGVGYHAVGELQCQVVGFPMAECHILGCHSIGSLAVRCYAVELHTAGCHVGYHIGECHVAGCHVGCHMGFHV